MTSSTAGYMALFRALESTAPSADRLFDDAYAEHFLPSAFQLLVRSSRSSLGRKLVLRILDGLWPGARASGVARTRLIDDALATAVREDKLEQIVLLGAGFDARAHRLSLGSDPVFFEVDRKETQATKRRRLSGRPCSNVRYVPCDFEAGSLRAGLEKAGFEASRPTFFIWEGVTNYLSPQAVDQVLESVRDIAPGSDLLFTYVDRLVLDEPDRFVGSHRLRSLLRSSDEPWTFGIDPSGLASFLEQRGFRLVCDQGSTDYRARYFGSSSSQLRGYEFYRAALALATPLARTQEEGKQCPR